MKKIKIYKNKRSFLLHPRFFRIWENKYRKKDKKEIEKTYGPTLFFNGDNLRKIFKLHDYSYNGRISNIDKFLKFVKFVTNQKINVILTVVGMMNEPRKWAKKNIKNYIEIYIKADLKEIIRLKKKKNLQE